MQGQVDAGAKGEEALVGADVGGGLLAADVLFAGLEGEHPAAVAAAVGRLADDAPGHLAEVGLAAGHDAQVGAAVGQGVAQRLAFGHDDVGAIVAGAVAGGRG